MKAVMTALERYLLSRQGRTGVALSLTARTSVWVRCWQR